MIVGWTIETSEGNQCRISGSGMVDEAQSTNDSNRAERGGRIGILAVILKIAKLHDIKKGHVKILIDNKQALVYGTRPRHGDGPFKHLADDYDLKCWTTKLET